MDQNAKSICVCARSSKGNGRQGYSEPTSFLYRKKTARPRRATRLAPEAAILGAAPSKGATGDVTPVPDGEAVPEGTTVPGIVVTGPDGPAGKVELT